MNEYLTHSGATGPLFISTTVSLTTGGGSSFNQIMRDVWRVRSDGETCQIEQPTLVHEVMLRCHKIQNLFSGPWAFLLKGQGGVSSDERDMWMRFNSTYWSAILLKKIKKIKRVCIKWSNTSEIHCPSAETQGSDDQDDRSVMMKLPNKRSNSSDVKYHWLLQILTCDIVQVVERLLRRIWCRGAHSKTRVMSDAWSSFQVLFNWQQHIPLTLAHDARIDHWWSWMGLLILSRPFQNETRGMW